VEDYFRSVCKVLHIFLASIVKSGDFCGFPNGTQLAPIRAIVPLRSDGPPPFGRVPTLRWVLCGKPAVAAPQKKDSQTT
jgi:hypothetical protein